jgi:hypothetical protein
MNDPLILVHFLEHISRMGTIECLFVTTQAKLDAQMDYEIELGSCLGKHSEIYVTMDEDNTRVVSEDQEKIAWLVSLKSDVCNLLPVGWDLVETAEELRLERGEEDEELAEDQ